MTKAIRSLFVCALFMAAVGAVAQEPVRVQVPFDFHVRSQTLSAGTYTVRRANDGQPDLLRIVGDGGSAVLLTAPVSATSGESRLIFRRYGDSYYLGGVDTSTGMYTLPQSRQERRDASRSTASEVVAGSR